MTPEMIAAFKVDRTGWAAGDWDGEPDRVDFHHAGFACLMLRNTHSGHWCGYVGVPSTHPAYGGKYMDTDIDVHGGLTYGEKCDGAHICHVAQPGESDDLFWLGFDCNHGCDLAPGRMMRDKEWGTGYNEPYASYRTEGYVRHQTKHLAEQLKEIQK